MTTQRSQFTLVGLFIATTLFGAVVSWLIANFHQSFANEKSRLIANDDRFFSVRTSIGSGATTGKLRITIVTGPASCIEKLPNNLATLPNVGKLKIIVVDESQPPSIFETDQNIVSDIAASMYSIPSEELFEKLSKTIIDLQSSGIIPREVGNKSR